MNTDVIIAGAGPVGLFLACELALAQCSVLILEKEAQPDSPLKQLPFGIRGLSSPTITALYHRGMLHQLELHKHMKQPHSIPGQPPKKPAGHFAGITLNYEDIDTSQWPYQLPGAPDFGMMSEMHELETVLTKRAIEMGVQIHRGLPITGFTQHQDGVTVQAGDQTFTTNWLVGCDGSRSVVRKQGGFEFAGTEPEFTGYSCKVVLQDPEKLRPGRNVMPTGMYFQSQPGYLLLQDFDGGAFHSSDKPVTVAYLQTLLRRIAETDVTISSLEVATTWTDRARQATAYRNGRVLLAGDAAHIHSPLGGQGLNLGIGDAMNLGWKLAATIHGTAPAGLLDTYFTERHPIGAKVLDWSRAQVAIMQATPASRALNAIFRDLINTRDGATYFAGRIWGIHNRYDLGDSHPLVGRIVPDFEFEDGTRLGELMQDGKGVLLDFTANSQFKSIAAGYNGRLLHTGKAAIDRLGLSVILVRPDGIVAWAGEPATFQELPEVIFRWFGNIEHEEVPLTGN
ncbi:2-polyprenyl-6-methoxyphenol hydroxylase [Chitinophaga jiangningensis]|uniref:2-polyprenyl-6-methoxyphenol hydroxylase n=1 Tax=Chitinophaga jiangningensis TaxID=1419482 RepID=A0A1M7A7S7_9BACT|nr:FAD-dependent monooxygenase [Chitinophaga jiangningensis]SHL38696.1 2-polyprenyl-6-methoxyphenol hydroxylase [Chitinophaga jiangningensis]